ncbi:choice-of-anchor Q domain-containing protein [Corallincola spongiicola]|uniref:Right handed beta helix domain-containing protein n=1 Tax=Corallincola spongiicola TaxID=2520508 RepID=A0ABY1WUH7_9GAMM|nr:choice-of-anchor Q domain-containing protein [Corallincola spongiicola]TAA48278.1 hypothetical protein EXY25_03330 [Corallincola spongiicola]
MVKNHPRVVFPMLVVSTLLTACGGGGSNEVVVEPPVESNIAQFYLGSQEPAELTLPAIADFSSIIFSNPLDVAESIAPPNSLSAIQPLAPTRRQAKSSRFTENCDSGRIEIYEDLNSSGLGVVEAEFQNCTYGSAVITGKLTTKITSIADSYDLTFTDFTYTYENLRIATQNGVYVERNGVLDQSGLNSCNAVTKTTMAISTNNINEHFYLKDLQTQKRCSDQDRFEVEIGGEIYIGKHGYVNVETLTPMLVDWGSLDFHIMSGLMELSTPLGVAQIRGEQSDTDLSAKTELLIDNDGDGTFEDPIRYPSWYVTDSVLSDFNDDDNDGMWNGWETYYGLNANFDDSEADIDYDGWSNLIEFYSGTSPSSMADSPNMEINFDWYLNENDQEYYSIYLFSEESNELNLKILGKIEPAILSSVDDWSVEVKTPSYIKLENFGDNCTSIPDDQENKVLCQLGNLQGLNSRGELNVFSSSISSEFWGGFTLYAKIASPSLEYVFSFGEKIDTYVTSSIEPSSVNSHSIGYSINSVSDGFSYDLILNSGNGPYIPGHKIIVRGNLSSNDTGSEIIGLDIDPTSIDIMNCNFDAHGFECISDYYQPITLRFSSPINTGHININYELTDIYSEQTSISNSEDRIIAIGQSTDTISQAASQLPLEGGSLSIESGIYVGQLEFDRFVDLKAAEGAELWLSPDYEDYGIQSEHKFNISGFDIYTGEYGLDISGGEISNNTFHIVRPTRIQVNSDKEVDFIGNRIYQNKTDYYLASTILKVPHGSKIINNIFSAIHEDAFEVIRPADEANNGKKFEIYNNTFINVKEFLSFYKNTDSSIINNIFYNPISLSIARNNPYYNIVSDVRNNILPARFENSELDEFNTVSDVPGFDVDDDFSLLFDSIAIDSGIEENGIPLVDIDGDIRPSGMAIDIGAYEYTQ